MERTTALTRDCFNALNQLRALEARQTVQPQVLHRRMCEVIDRLLEGARDQAIPERDAKDMAYAIAALADEIAVDKGGGIDEYWRSHLLQTKYFDDTTAGEGFFRRIEPLRRDHRRVEVLKTYYLCLLLGFQGVYLGRPEGDLRRLTESIGREIEDGLDLPEALSPDGARPDEAMIRRKERRTLQWVALGTLAASMSIYIALRIVLDVKTRGIVESVSAGAAPAREQR